MSSRVVRRQAETDCTLCRYCGLETGCGQSHATQGECIEALRVRVKELEEDLSAHTEIAFHEGSHLRDLYLTRRSQLDALQGKLEEREQVAEAIKRAVRRGTRKDWNRLLLLLEELEERRR